MPEIKVRKADGILTTMAVDEEFVEKMHDNWKTQASNEEIAREQKSTLLNMKENEIRDGLKRCKLNSPIWCGNCPYVKLRGMDDDITKCTSELCKDAEALIDKLAGNHLRVIGIDE